MGSGTGTSSLIIPYCTKEPTPPHPWRPEMESPADIVTRWQEAWNAADAAALAALFAEDAEFVNVVGLWWHDRASIRDAHEFGFRTIFPGSTMSMGEPRVR